MNGIVVAYSGVHQAYQLALAAHEVNLLEAFHCSFYDAPGCWGGVLSRVFGSESMRSRRVQGLPVDHIVEHPLPLFQKLLRDRLIPSRRDDWLACNDGFDRLAAKALIKSPPKIFVGAETCDLHCLEACTRTGTVRVHDCPQLHPTFLEQIMQEAASKAGVDWKPQSAQSAMRERSLREYELGQHLLIYSEVHRRSFERAGYAPERLFECPLWVDTNLWNRLDDEKQVQPGRPLRLLFAGSQNLRKGIPFLLEALRSLQGGFTLTLVGPLSSDIKIPDEVGGCPIKMTGPLSKARLREAYVQHDLFVLPSVADSFGFVALEAMACGIPAILTENCGAPVPDESWRVKAMDAHALANRLAWYLDEPERVLEHGLVAREFAQRFTPKRYRQEIQKLLLRLHASNGVSSK